jgi:hypothetical protein
MTLYRGIGGSAAPLPASRTVPQLSSTTLTDGPIVRWGMIGPQLCAAMVDSSHQEYLNALWAFNRDYFEPSYYNAELQLLPMLVASGNWWTPT